MQQESSTRTEICAPGGCGTASVLMGKELTPRERRVLRLMSAGMDDAQIAQELSVNILTVRVLGSNALMKLGVAPGLTASLLGRQAGSLQGGLQASAVADRVEGR